MVKKYPKKQGLESRINAFYFPVRCFDGFSYASFWKYGLFTGESKVYFNASGKAKSPQVLLSSDPPMEQRDIISYLVTGKPLYQQRANSANETPQGRTGDNTAQNIAAAYISQKAASTVGEKLE